MPIAVGTPAPEPQPPRVQTVPGTITLRLPEGGLGERQRAMLDAVLRLPDHAIPAICPNPDCTRPFDQDSGRYCPSCQDYERTCCNDHCFECGTET